MRLCFRPIRTWNAAGHNTQYVCYCEYTYYTATYAYMNKTGVKLENRISRRSHDLHVDFGIKENKHKDCKFQSPPTTSPEVQENVSKLETEFAGKFKICMSVWYKPQKGSTGVVYFANNLCMICSLPKGVESCCFALLQRFPKCFKSFKNCHIWA